jgi:hypothetical protein
MNVSLKILSDSSFTYNPIIRCYIAGILNLFPSTSTIVGLLFVSQHRYKLSIKNYTVYKYVKDHYAIQRKHRGAHEHQIEIPAI